MASDDRRRIGRSLAWLLRRGWSDTRPVARPACEFGLIVDERLKDMAEDLEAVKSLLRWLLMAVATAMIGLVVDVVMRGM